MQHIIRESNFKATSSVCVGEDIDERLLSCSLKNSEKPRRVPISDVPIARSEKASTIYETPLHFTLHQVKKYGIIKLCQLNAINIV